MDLIISLIIVLSPTEYYLKDIPIHEPCEVWFEKNVYHTLHEINFFLLSTGPSLTDVSR